MPFLHHVLLNYGLIRVVIFVYLNESSFSQNLLQIKTLCQIF